MLIYEEISCWCAGCKVSGITATTLSLPQFPSIETIMENAYNETEASVVCVTANEDEATVLAWLKGNDFERGPAISNWLHDGRTTWMFFKQIDREYFDD